MTKKKIALVLSGCGNRDGAEITEAVSVLIALDQLNTESKVFAPSVNFHPLSHLDGIEQSEQTRNTLVEAARIARGQIQDLNELQVKDFDALIFSGGAGAARILSDWQARGSKCQVHPVVEKLILGFHSDSKPIGAICIAPVLLAKVLGKHSVNLTIGNEAEVIAEINKTGAVHEICPVDDYITDRENKCVTTPAYMYDAGPAQVFKGILGLVKEVWEMA